MTCLLPDLPVEIGNRLLGHSPERWISLSPLLDSDIVSRLSHSILTRRAAYIERLNGTFRARLAPLARRTHHLVHRKEMLHAGMYLVGALYNVCTYHTSLGLTSGEQRTPALAAGLTEHCWTVQALLWQRIPPPRWEPPNHRGRRSKAVQHLIERWATP